MGRLVRGSPSDLVAPRTTLDSRRIARTIKVGLFTLDEAYGCFLSLYSCIVAVLMNSKAWNLLVCAKRIASLVFKINDIGCGRPMTDVQY